MIEKLKTEQIVTGSIFNPSYFECPSKEETFEKINEVIDHLNTQEEKERVMTKEEYEEWFNSCVGLDKQPNVSNETVTSFLAHHLGRQLESNKSDTASNQSNTEPTERSKGETITYKCKRCSKANFLLDYLDKVTLPQKIKLLKDRAGFPEGEYILGGEGSDYGNTYRSNRNESGCSRGIHKEIVKATSGQGIRSDLTDGEERLDRPIEINKELEPTTESVSHSIEENTGLWDGEGNIDAPDPYEECAEEILDYIYGPDEEEDTLVEILKKHFPLPTK